MRTSNMIYQAAVAHQTELRRTAAERSRTTARDSGRAPWIHLFSSVATRRSRALSAAQPVAATVAMRRVSA